jgi:DNA-binding CsgD family transcriptional regulator
MIKYLIGFGFEITRDELKMSFNKIDDIYLVSANSIKNKKLSKRELEITRYIVNSMTDKEIAAELNISINTTKTHRKRIIHKLGLKNTASLVKYSIESGLVNYK